MNLKKILVLVVVVTLVIAYFAFDLGRYADLQALKDHHATLKGYYAENPVLTIGVFFLIYVVAAALSLPFAALMTIAAGIFFGFVLGTVVVSFASTIGATLAFLASRFLLRDTIQRKYGARLKRINDGVEKEGGFYLFTMRLIPAFPFWLINLGMGVTPMRTWTFYWVSQVGMLAGTMAYVFAGAQVASRLEEIRSFAGLVSPGVIGALVLLGIFPLIAKKIVDAVKRSKYLRRYRAPAKFDYNLVVIGAGSGGLVSAYIAAAVNAKVALIEKDRMGGDCLNTGCVPSKSLIRSARVLAEAKRSKDFGLAKVDVEFDFAEVMERVQRVIAKIEPHDSVERYEGLGVDCLEGTAKIVDPYTVEVDGRQLTTRNIVIATGAGPLVPPIDGIDEVGVLTSDGLWEIRELPRRLAVVGGGPIGSEMAQTFARLGSEVTQIEAGPRLMSKEDPEVGEFVAKRFGEEGIRVLVGHRVAAFEKAESGAKVVVCELEDGEQVRIECDEILMALGRRPNVKGFGLEELEVRTTKQGTVEVDELLRTNYPNIFAVGDVAGPYQFTHFAAHQAWYATVNALFSPLKTFKADYRVIPWCTFIEPEVAHVGLNEQQAEQEGVEYEVTRYGIDDLDRAIADSDDEGFVKVLTVPGKDRILGVTIVGPHAGDVLAEYVLAMKHGIGLNKILGTVHTYPTIAEANKYAAGQWKQANKPEGILRWIGRFHTMRRSRGRNKVFFGALIVVAGLLLIAAVGAWRFFTPAPGPVPKAAPDPDAEATLAPVRTTFRGEAVYADTAVDRYRELLAAIVDDEGWVDYAALTADNEEGRAMRDRLRDYNRTVAHLDPATYGNWGRDRQLAFWINVYNSLTLEIVAKHHPSGTSLYGLLQGAPSESIRQIPWVWHKVTFQVMGERLTLNEIEHEIIRPRFGEPRIHFAINCASAGCPPLRAEPYTGADLEAQLEAQTRTFLRDKEQTRVRIDRDAGTVALSSIFAWFKPDFAAHAPDSGFESVAGEGDRALLNFVAGYLDAEDARHLREGDYRLTFFGYDWNLNSQARYAGE